MKRTVFLILAFAATFCLGFAFKALTTNTNNTNKMKRATGIGGIFFKCKDPNKMKEWYKTHLGLNTNEYGTVFECIKVLTVAKKDLHNGVHLMKIQNTLSLLKRNL